MSGLAVEKKVIDLTQESPWARQHTPDADKGVQLAGLSDGPKPKKIKESDVVRANLGKLTPEAIEGMSLKDYESRFHHIPLRHIFYQVRVDLLKGKRKQKPKKTVADQLTQPLAGQPKRIHIFDTIPLVTVPKDFVPEFKKLISSFTNKHLSQNKKVEVVTLADPHALEIRWYL